MQTVTVHPKYNKFNRKFNDDVAVVSIVLPKEKFNQKHALRLCTSSDPVGVQLLMVGFGPAGHPHLSEEVGKRPEVLQETSLMEPKNPTAQGCGKDFDVKRQICFTHRHGREGDSGENICFFLSTECVEELSIELCGTTNELLSVRVVYRENFFLEKLQEKIKNIWITHQFRFSWYWLNSH